MSRLNNFRSKVSIAQLHKANLTKISNHNQLLDYISKTGDILVDYYSGHHEHDLTHQYLMLTDTNYRIKHSKIEVDRNCDNCNVLRLYYEDEGRYVCPNCGETEYTLPNLSKQSDSRQKHYVRITYLKEALNRLQSREPTHVPDSIIAIIKTKMIRAHVKADECTARQIRTIMKNNRLHKYYPHIQQIYYAITGSQPISISKQTEQKIIHMFNQVEHIFDKLYPDNGKFLNYSYLLNKLFHKLHMPDIANCFALLKDRKKLIKQDYMFYRICKQLNWKQPDTFLSTYSI